MGRVILVAGTGGWHEGEWNEATSPFVAYLRSHQVEPIFADNRPFTWSTDLGGVGFGDKDLRCWHAGGINLYSYIVPPLCPDKRIPPIDTNVITHSHGLQVALFACAEGLKINTLISVCGPIRKDMAPVAAKARPNITKWINLYSDGSDRWQWFGEFFDGHLGIVREAPLADVNKQIPETGHSGLVRDPQFQPQWDTFMPALGGV